MFLYDKKETKLICEYLQNRLGETGNFFVRLWLKQRIKELEELICPTN